MAAGATVTNDYAAHAHAKSTWSQLEHKMAQVSGVAAVNLLESAISSSPRMADDASQTTNEQTKHDPSGEDKSKDTPPKATEGKDDTASLIRQLLAALEKHEKQGEHSKGEEIPSLPYLDRAWSTSSTLVGVKTTRQHATCNRQLLAHARFWQV